MAATNFSSKIAGANLTFCLSRLFGKQALKERPGAFLTIEDFSMSYKRIIS
jgi:hypothetical protein